MASARMGKASTPHDIEKHVWAMNEVQRFFIEETRLGIPVDFTNEGLRGVAFSTATSFPSEFGRATHGIRNWSARLAASPPMKRAHSATQTFTRRRSMFLATNAGDESKILMAKILIWFRVWVSRWPRRCRRTIRVAATAKHFAVYSVGKGAREGQARTDPQVSPRRSRKHFAAAVQSRDQRGGHPRRDEFIQRL